MKRKEWVKQNNENYNPDEYDPSIDDMPRWTEKEKKLWKKFKKISRDLRSETGYTIKSMANILRVTEHQYQAYEMARQLPKDSKFFVRFLQKFEHHLDIHNMKDISDLMEALYGGKA